jgi:S-(hydroxymethyl)glutathione dehydrogenase/alcohol dehydrogenase
VDFAFEVVGAEALQTQALQMTRRGGTTVFVGIAGGGKFVLPTLQLAMEDRTVKGSYYGSARVTRDYPRFIELIESGRVDLGGMVTKHFSLEEVNTALGAMRDGEVVRGVLMGS